MPAEHKRNTSTAAAAPPSITADDGDEQICLSVGLFRANHRLPDRLHPERASLTCTLIYDDGTRHDHTKPGKWDNTRFGDWRRAFFIPRTVSQAQKHVTIRIEAHDPPASEPHGNTTCIAHCECLLQDVLDQHAKDYIVSAHSDVEEWDALCHTNQTEFVLNAERVSQYHHSDTLPVPAKVTAVPSAEPSSSTLAVPAPSPRSGPVADKDGNSSVSAATMETAHRRARSTAIATTLVGAAVGSAIGEGVHRRLNSSATATTASSTAGATPSSSSSGTSDAAAIAASEHAAARTGGLAGAAVGGVAGGMLAPVFNAVARRIGAHQCDQCRRDGLYQYWVCQQCPGSYDLCDTCHSSFTKEQQSTASATQQRHAPDHTFVFHHNGIESFKLMMIFLLVMWIIMNVIF